MKILVIGSGLLGVTTAYFLARYGQEVMVLDRAEGVGVETSFANGGMLTPSQANPWNAPGMLWKILSWIGKDEAPLLLRPKALPSLSLWSMQFLRNSSQTRYMDNTLRNVRLANYSLRVLQSLREETEIRYEQSTRGTMKVFRDQRSIDRSAALAEKLVPHGVVHRVVDGAGAVKIEPALAPVSEKLVGGIHYPNDEAGDAYKFCRALSDRAAELGTEFLFYTEVLGFQHDGRRVLSVDLSHKRLEADVFVVAAGSYSPLLVKALGISLPISPVKGYSITLPLAKHKNRQRIPIVDDGLHAAVTPLGDRIRVAGTAEFTGYDKALREERIQNLFRLLRQVFPDYAADVDDSQTERWTGLRPMTVDGVPVLGRSSYENLYFNTGHGHLGWTMAAGSGKAVADLIVGDQVKIDLADYRFDRF
jgi:D-amino-acid dehydrogenase